MTRLPFLLLLIAGCTPPSPVPHGLPGKWNNITKRDGDKADELVASFRADGSYDATLNGKALVSGGAYEESGDTIRFHDPVCNNTYTGQYLLKYVNDSVYFRLISDSCTLRRGGTDGVGLKRILMQ